MIVSSFLEKTSQMGFVILVLDSSPTHPPWILHVFVLIIQMHFIKPLSIIFLSRWVQTLRNFQIRLINYIVLLHSTASWLLRMRYCYINSKYTQNDSIISKYHLKMLQHLFRGTIVLSTSCASVAGKWENLILFL